MIYGQLNPEVMAAMRGRLGIGMGMKNAGPTSYQAPQFPAGMSQYTPQPQLPSQVGNPGNTGIVPPHMQFGGGMSAWASPMGLNGATIPNENPIQRPLGEKIPGAQLPPSNPIFPPSGKMPGVDLPPGNPVYPPGGNRIPGVSIPQENPIQAPGATIPQENPIQGPRNGMRRPFMNHMFWY